MPRIERPPADVKGVLQEPFTEILDVLTRGDVEVEGLLPYASNYTYLARVTHRERALLAVYKPRRGEQPLWDFPRGTLAGREVAAFVVSEMAGFHLVPPTVLREQGPAGPGSLQAFVHHDPNRHLFVLAEEGRHDLQPLTAFDVVINNADRKAGHVIEDDSGRLWGLDHGVSFHVEPKLRTVLWDLAGRPISSGVRTGLERLLEALDGELAERLRAWLSIAEIDALRERAYGLAIGGRFPHPSGGRPWPWPLV